MPMSSPKACMWRMGIGICKATAVKCNREAERLNCYCPKMIPADEKLKNWQNFDILLSLTLKTIKKSQRP